ncbi:MAG: SDR family NAD(P)-dependent oxidoreductase [Deltaproteobacteria bacterium]|nr:MAG: SDR family NAD(P)-dependent oxidoreductase [Deltaproteobacteria bacterium]
MGSKILVTGATGTIGSFVCEQLKDVNADFIAMVRSEEKAKLLNEKGIKTVVGDFADIDSLENAFQGIDKVFLLSVTSPESPELQGNLVKVAKEKGVKHIVKLSVRGADLESDIGILRYHALTEKEIKDSGIAYTFLQPHSFMQNLVFDAESIKNQSVIFAPMGEGKIGMVDARDIAAVAIKALTENGHEGKTYVLTGAKALSFHDISNAFTFFLERDIKYIPVSVEDAHQGMLDAGMPEWLANDLTAINKIYAAGQGSEISNDIERVIGRKAGLLKEYLRDYIDLYN